MKALLAIGGGMAGVILLNFVLAIRVRLEHARERKRWKLDHEADMERLATRYETRRR
jgi:hypothetical protein